MSAELRVSVQLFNLQTGYDGSPAAPPPEAYWPVAELPVSVQLFSVPPYAPPPEENWPVAELPVKVQLFSVPPLAPPPKPAELPTTTQLETTDLVGSRHTPPPLDSR